MVQDFFRLGYSLDYQAPLLYYILSPKYLINKILPPIGLASFCKIQVLTAEYRVVIELLWNALSRGITQLEVRIDSQLVVSQLNRTYQVRNPILLR